MIQNKSVSYIIKLNTSINVAIYVKYAKSIQVGPQDKTKSLILLYKDLVDCIHETSITIEDSPLLKKCYFDDAQGKDAPEI